MVTVAVDYKNLQTFCKTVLEKSLPKDEAKNIAISLVDADLLGIHSHGVSRLTDYLVRMEDGLIERETKFTLENESHTTALYDAHNGWGQIVSKAAMENAIDKALNYGTGFVGVKNSNHFGTATYYTRMAAEKGCIGIAMTNGSAIMVPFGSREPSLGTNPLSIAIPAGEGKDPIILDMATSNVARGKIILANKNNESIPEGWAITKDGKQTTDAKEALEGFILPMGPKGSGLAIIIDILSGVLTGSLFGKDIPKMYGDPEPQQLGHFFGAINIESFIGKEDFYKNIDKKVKETVESKPSEGFDRVYMPGEIEMNRKRRREKEGVPLSQDIFNELEATGKKYGVEITDYLQVAAK
ncbi:Ldh family oxidoreductase [Planococcus halotolerans]|uniref:Ldh family oxidoreductase n=1 Tax=Planococcus halotolerans TaxID=2233542 RepID=UPI001092B40A|nr:Ldh family oxidoreductase [Planococcus halotolerans]QHJ70106.1 Ldh family oxidoreductase [Planococcus halotolerans]